MNAFRNVALSTVAVAASFAAVRTASAQFNNTVLWAANNGVDSGSCGTQASPCRSISQAVSNAPAGATVRVGPGRYGDLDNDGAYDAGDEGPRTSGRQGLLQIEKAIRISSTHGAELTTIDFGPSAAEPRAVVAIRASNVYFGDVGLGFTLVGVNTSGIRLEGGTRRNVRILGNIVRGLNGIGIYVYTTGDAISVSDNLVAQNTASGLFVNIRRPSGSTAPILIERNTIRENGNPLRVAAVNARVFGNVIDGNLNAGAQVLAGSAGIQMERNFFIGNRGGALEVVERASATAPAPLDRFVLNTVVGNASFGVRERGRAIQRFDKNNIYGNGFGGGAGTTFANCGLVVDGGYPGGNVIATNSFWGAASGPGADPADGAGPGSGCGSASSSTQVAPFAAAPFVIDVLTDD
jgi:hypothetical protein